MTFPSLAASAQEVIPCTQEIAYKTLIDYDAWPEWLPSVKSARLLTREDMLAIVELGLNREGAATLMMECIETPRKGLLARVIEGDAPIHEMEWRVEPADAGFAKVGVTVKRRIGLNSFHPAAWNVLNPAKCLAALRSQVATANPGPEAVTDGENLFELWETEAGLVCWIRGKKYDVTPAGEQQDMK
jgi:hypothetical protein